MRKRRGSVVRKSIAGIIVPLVFLSVVVCFLGYRCLTEAMSMLYERGAVEIAVSALSGVESIKTISVNRPLCMSAKAEEDPTNPQPTIPTFLAFISMFLLSIRNRFVTVHFAFLCSFPWNTMSIPEAEEICMLKIQQMEKQ